MPEDMEHLKRQDGDRSRYLLQPFLSYAFVCIYLEQKRHKGNKIIKERQNRTQNEDVHCLQGGGPVSLSLATSLQLSVPEGFCLST